MTTREWWQEAIAAALNFPPMGWPKEEGGVMRVVPLGQIYKTTSDTGEIAAMPDGDATVKSPEEHVTERVDQIIKDFDGGKIGRGDAIRVRDRATRAVKDMEGYKGFGKRYGEEGYGEE